MLVKNFASNRNAVENGATVILSNEVMAGKLPEKGICQVKITGTITVLLQGRLTADHDWATVNTFTATGYKEVELFPHMRYSITVASGTLNSMDVGFVRR